MGILNLILWIVLLSVCSVAARKGNHDNHQLLQRLQRLEDEQKRSGARMSKLEGDFHAQTNVIEEQNKTIYHLEETVNKLKSTIENAYRTSRRNRRNISLIKGILLKQDFKDGSSAIPVNNGIPMTHRKDNINHDEPAQTHKIDLHQHSHQQNHKTNTHEHSRQQNHKTNTHDHSRQQNHKTNSHYHSRQQIHQKTNTHEHSHQQNHKTNTHKHSRQQNHKTNTHNDSRQQNHKTNSLDHSRQQNHKTNTHEHYRQKNHKTNLHEHSQKQNHKTNTHEHSQKQNNKTNTIKSTEKTPKYHNHHKDQYTAIPTNTNYKKHEAGHKNSNIIFGSRNNHSLQYQIQNHHKPPHSGHRGHVTSHSKPVLHNEDQHKQNGNASNGDSHVHHYSKHENKPNRKEDSGSSHRYENQKTRHMFLDESQNRQRSMRTRRQTSGGIAFSVYLDHDATVAQHETLKFNKVITNDGDGYNAQTGIFTCAEGGVYMLTFSIGQRDQGHYMWAELMVNSKNMIDAVVDTYHPAQDLQGGNTVIVRLKTGDRVWIDATHNGSHVEGSGTLRLTTFSGLFLYS